MREETAVRKPTASRPEALVEAVVAQFCDVHKLTPREMQVVLLICSGVKNVVVAMRMGVSEATVRLHITNIHRKLGTASKAELVLRAFGWWLACEQDRTRVHTL